MSHGKKSTWGTFPPPPHPTLRAGGLSPGRKGLPLTELLHTHAQAPRFLLQIHGLPSVLAGAPSKTTGELHSAPAFPDGPLCDPGKVSDLSVLVAADLSPSDPLHGHTAYATALPPPPRNSGLFAYSALRSHSPGLSSSLSASIPCLVLGPQPTHFLKVTLTVGGSGAPVATVFNEEKQFGKHGSPRCERKNADGTSKLLLCELPGPRNSYSVTDVFSKHDHHDNLHPHGLLTW